MIQLTDNILAVPVPYDAEDFTFDKLHYNSWWIKHLPSINGVYQTIPTAIDDRCKLELLGTVNTETGEMEAERGQVIIWGDVELLKSKGCKGRYAIIKRL